MYEINLVAEGLRKIGMIEWLIRNKSLKEDTILIIDEPESGLNPASIVMLAEIIYRLFRKGLIIFIATHNFFFLKKSHILAKKDNRADAKIFALERPDDKILTTEALLRHQIPANKILEVAMDLYNEEVESMIKDILE